jgi:hypothetical protein
MPDISTNSYAATPFFRTRATQGDAATNADPVSQSAVLLDALAVAMGGCFLFCSKEMTVCTGGVLAALPFVTPGSWWAPSHKPDIVQLLSLSAPLIAVSAMALAKILSGTTTAVLVGASLSHADRTLGSSNMLRPTMVRLLMSARTANIVDAGVAATSLIARAQDPSGPTLCLKECARTSANVALVAATQARFGRLTAVGAALALNPGPAAPALRFGFNFLCLEFDGLKKHLLDCLRVESDGFKKHRFKRLRSEFDGLKKHFRSEYAKHN